jgi:photoactive yellow protein
MSVGVCSLAHIVVGFSVFASALIGEEIWSNVANPTTESEHPMAAELPSFDAPQIAAQLTLMSDVELDALPFGVVEMDHQFKVMRYNATEARYSGLARDRVIGQHFFRDVAPWANNRRVAKRYQLDSLDETIDYTFSLRMKPMPATLRMLKLACNERMYLLVTWA